MLVIPDGLRRAICARAQRAPVQVLINGDNANTATTVLGYALTILRSAVARAHCGRRATPRPPVARRAARLVQPGAAQHAVPRARAHRLHRDDHGGRLDRAVDRPRKGARHDGAGAHGADSTPFSFVVGKTLPYFVISLASAMRDHSRVDGALRAADARVAGCCCCSRSSLFLVGALGLGLLISTLADTQQVAFQAALLASFLPTLMLSGFIFPIASMPARLQCITYVVPARYFLIALRGDRAEGRRRSQAVWPQLVALRDLRAASCWRWRRCGWHGRLD